MLTERAMFERKWEGLPLLAELIGQRRLSADGEVRLYGPSSVSDNIFEIFRRLVEVSTLVRDQREVLREFVAQARPEEVGKLDHELYELRARMQELSRYLSEGLPADIDRVFGDDDPDRLTTTILAG